LTLFSGVVGGRTAALLLDDVVESRDLVPPLSLLSVAVQAALLSPTNDGGKTGPCRSGGGDVMLLALDMSGRALDDNRRADEDSPPPLMKFSSLSTHASW